MMIQKKIVLIFIIVTIVSVFPVCGASIRQIDDLYAQKEVMTAQQWEEATYNLRGTFISLTGTILEVEKKGWVFREVAHLHDRQTRRSDLLRHL